MCSELLDRVGARLAHTAPLSSFTPLKIIWTLASPGYLQQGSHAHWGRSRETSLSPSHAPWHGYTRLQTLVYPLPQIKYFWFTNTICADRSWEDACPTAFLLLSVFALNYKARSAWPHASKPGPYFLCCCNPSIPDTLKGSSHIHSCAIRQSLHSHLLPPCHVKQSLSQRKGPRNTLGDFQQSAQREIHDENFERKLYANFIATSVP